MLNPVDLPKNLRAEFSRSRSGRVLFLSTSFGHSVIASSVARGTVSDKFHVCGTSGLDVWLPAWVLSRQHVPGPPYRRPKHLTREFEVAP